VFDFPIHPLTGLQAIGFTKLGRPIWPVMGGSAPNGEPGGDGGGGDGSGEGGDGSGDGDGQQPSGDLGFPANTPIRDMNPEQQAAYWKHHDRRKSDTLKAYEGITPEQAKQFRQQADEAARAQMTPADQALADARAQGAADAEQAAATKWAGALTESVVGRFVPKEEDRQVVLAGLDPMRFMKDGQFDTDALIGHLTGLSAAFGGNAGGEGQGEQEQPRQWGQQGGTPPAPSASDVGLAEAARRGYVKK
jgi:hypothetical protein